MFGQIEITPLHWAGFIAIVLVFLALDLGVFHRRAHVVKFREALLWTTVWCVLSLVFCGALAKLRNRQESLEFITGYIIELSLSMDNVFVIAVLFAYFRVPLEYQHRVLFWGILGALVMRGAMIGLGAALIDRFDWMLYVLGAVLVFTGVRMILVGDRPPDPEKNIVIRAARRLFPVTAEFNGQKFFASLNGRTALTPLALVLLMVETTDLLFAVDSIPAIFAVTKKPFIVFTSNVFAILGLRSLYFVLAGAIGYFRFLKVGLSLVLCFIGTKMLLGAWDVDISITVSLAVVASIILTSVVFSVLAARREQSTGDKAGRDPEADSP
ncbi:MAG TPA: TerC family protein [Candidatus Angelobacter sp.]|nr:TerC family protein [Candidatus Angelobacter sp.]